MLTTVSATRREISHYSVYNNKRRHELGQHLLNSHSFAESIVDLAELNKHEVVLEIGTGSGILTELIARRARQVVSFEVDKRLFEMAKERLSCLKNVQLHLQDAFERSLETPTFDVCISSIPYSRSLDFVEWIATAAKSFRTAIVLVQDDFAGKLLSRPGEKSYRAVSVVAQASFRMEKLAVVGREFFSPPPKVLSALMRLSPHQGIPFPVLDPQDIQYVKQLFSFRGRILRRALNDDTLIAMVGHEFGDAILVRRIETLDPTEFVQILRTVRE